MEQQARNLASCQGILDIPIYSTRNKTNSQLMSRAYFTKKFVFNKKDSFRNGGNAEGQQVMLQRLCNSMVEEKDKRSADFRSLIVHEAANLVTFDDSYVEAPVRTFLSNSKKEENLKKLLDMNRMGKVTQEQNDWIKQHTFQRNFEDKVKGRDVEREAEESTSLHQGRKQSKK